MTYRALHPWVPLDELLLLPLSKRIKYVRENIASDGGRTAYLNQDQFAFAVGAKDRYRVIGWEVRAETPRDYAAEIAALTPYPPAAFGADGATELVEETLGRSLRSLRAEVAWMRSQLVRAFAALGLQLELPEEEPPAQSDGVRP